ncbi:hypothetical protein RF11_10257 [Thelohanellus kitauei]|uniref:Uncharacterized protein n=1 Tax=Thelohanellus kitauei TaxID=669202 RepID=A0A0C2J2X0_THEKT|nr:hypothetical protein RF11_10257 [Thelohanellus kitauei]
MIPSYLRRGICGAVYCSGPASSDPNYRFTVGSTTLLEDPNDKLKNKVPIGGVCGPSQICYEGSCIPVDKASQKCYYQCKEYEECNGKGLNCVPNDQKWFEAYEGSPDEWQ